MRYIYRDVARDSNGIVLRSATVNVYLAGTTTAATIYTSSTSTTGVNSVTTDSTDGSFTFYVDAFDYGSYQKFKFVLSKPSLSDDTFTADEVSVDEVVTGTYTISTAKTFNYPVTIPYGVTFVKSGSGTITVNADFKAGLYQVFDSTFSTGVTFNNGSASEVYPEWWGAKADGTTDCVNAIISARKAFNTIKFSRGTYYVSDSIDFTNVIGLDVKTSGTKGTIITAATGSYPIIDLTGSTYVTIDGMLINTKTGANRTIGILTARIGSASSGSHVFNDIQIIGNFTIAGFYSASSESNSYRNPLVELHSTGSTAFRAVDLPEVGVASKYQSFGSISGGNTYYKIYGGQFMHYNDGAGTYANSANRQIYLQNTRNSSFYGTYVYSPPGAGSTVVQTASIEIQGGTGQVSETDFINLDSEGYSTNSILIGGKFYNSSISGFFGQGNHTTSILGDGTDDIRNCNFDRIAPVTTGLNVTSIINSSVDCGGQGINNTVNTTASGNYFYNGSSNGTLTLPATKSGNIIQSYNYSTGVTTLIANTTFVQANGNPWPGDATATRAVNTVYQNTNTRPLFITVTASATATATTTLQALVGSTNPPGNTLEYKTIATYEAGNYMDVQFIVLPNYYYKVNGTNATLGVWCETAL